MPLFRRRPRDPGGSGTTPGPGALSLDDAARLRLQADRQADESLRLKGESDRLQAAGDLVGAAGLLAQACDVFRALIQFDPADCSPLPQSYGWFGDYLEGLGVLRLQLRDNAGAIAALAEALIVYGRIPAAASRIPLVAATKAQAAQRGGKPLTAIADVGHAVIRVLDLPPERRIHVMALAADTQLLVRGDPDLAVGAADWALQHLMPQLMATIRSGGGSPLPDDDAALYLTASRVAAIVHEASGRAALAAGTRLLRQRSGLGDIDEHPEIVAVIAAGGQPSLAQALGRASRPDLAADLTAPVEEKRLFAPAMRCATGDAPRYARQLADLATEAQGPDRDLLALEAHALYAFAWRQLAPELLDKFGDYGPGWASAVLGFGQRAAETGRTEAALDAAGWLDVIVRKLLSIAPPTDDIRETATRAARWQRQTWTAIGDTEAAARAHQVVKSLAAPGRD